MSPRDFEDVRRAVRQAHAETAGPFPPVPCDLHGEAILAASALAGHFAEGFAPADMLNPALAEIVTLAREHHADPDALAVALAQGDPDRVRFYRLTLDELDAVPVHVGANLRATAEEVSEAARCRRLSCAMAPLLHTMAARACGFEEAVATLREAVLAERNRGPR